MAQEEEITELLRSYQAFITYVPLRGEVPFLDYLTLPTTDLLYQVTPRATLDPATEAENAQKLVHSSPTAVLLPGRAFDAAGTRHGRGGGWYDRFLAQVPREWLRVGFCYDYQFSPKVLIRETWDMPMDVVCVIKSGTSHTRIYKTGA